MFYSVICHLFFNNTSISIQRLAPDSLITAGWSTETYVSNSIQFDQATSVNFTANHKITICDKLFCSPPTARLYNGDHPPADYSDKVN